MTIHPFPGQSCAERHITSHLATDEQRRAAADLMGLTYPDDLLWAAPGAPVIGAEAVEVPAPDQYRLSLSNRLKEAIWSGAVGAYGLACGVAGGLMVAIVLGRL
jgi:hypothetical protein